MVMPLRTFAMIYAGHTPPSGLIVSLHLFPAFDPRGVDVAAVELGARSP